ncbi:MAG: tRNA lysidine(34) synthetase TilS [bacterium]
MTLLETTRSFLLDYFDPPLNNEILVAVSGGSDSMTLLDLLRRLGDSLGFTPVPVHVNYRFHDQSNRAFDILADYCDTHGLGLVGKSIRQPGVHREAAEGLEARARSIRLEFFKQQAQRFSSDGIFLAHHRLDQVETIIMNVGRGCGPGALAGMSPAVDHGALILYRPLLKTPQRRIKEYVEDRELNYIDDPSNENERFARNKIRHTLIPEWRTAQPAPVEAVSKLSQRVTRENDFWKTYLEDNISDWTWENEIQVPRNSFKSLHRAAQFRYLRSLVERLAGSMNGWDEQNLRDVRELFVDARSGARLSLPGPVHALNEYDRGCLFSTTLSRSTTKSGPFSLPETISWMSVGRIEMARTSETNWAIEEEDRLLVSFPDNVLSELRIQTWSEGDTVRTESGEAKLKELFDQKKIPFRARRYWPVLISGGQIIGVPGLVQRTSIGDDVSLRFTPNHPAFHQLKNRYAF